jgi:hypothetical protein
MTVQSGKGTRIQDSPQASAYAKPGNPKGDGILAIVELGDQWKIKISSGRIGEWSSGNGL